jgi:hypothetical protein
MNVRVRSSNNVALMGLQLELDNSEAQALLKLSTREINDFDAGLEEDELQLLIELQRAAIKYDRDRFEID